MQIKAQIDGFADLLENLDRLKNEIGQAKTDVIYRKALKGAMQPVLADAKSFAPKDTGQLAEHIKLVVRRPTEKDKRSKYYRGESFLALVQATPDREDTRINLKLTKKGKFQKVLSNLKPVAVSQEFGNSKVAAHPFLRPALEVNRERVQNALGWLLWDGIQKIEMKKVKS